MRQRRLLRFHGLKRPRVRQTWNKYNLFNLTRLRTPLLQNKTFFQQKWIAKSMTRGYHGEHIKEYQWERMFSRRLLSAVNMDPAYMAQYDGSEQASGRGSGQKRRPGTKNHGPRNKGNINGPTPYMQMIFAPMERRLDVAIFRALFASSARQARQFVLHGAVTVNGKKMTYPGYLLNPGDMFQVNIERVMAATGRPKMPNKNQKALPPSSEATEAAEGEEGEAAEGEATEAAEGAAEPVDADAAKENHRAALKGLKDRARKIMLMKNVHMRAKQKQSLRKFLQEVKTNMDRTRKASDPSKAEMDDVERELTALLSDLSLTPAQLKAEAKKAYIERNKKRDRQLAAAAADTNADASTTTKTIRAGAAAASLGLLTESQQSVLKWMMQREAENPHDASKPYATPWKPREWMSPFAFIPRYLEVNQRVCAAVYLRHPVARPGKSEVPSPFSPTLSQLAFNWYLRRG
ncbi:hypothetical protein C8A01DRAFT_13063 [Parachaetomium inaequale]|uniref:RNA-binding S4 domain-containing protein n=1 Tax=Parachaetomium inaequale TaxID=2588326 RepID=A0AAN6PR42_9PEZI|nr:hypothetical protein C8A01DRAFT_13063 [Parachaetomium inaequale]